MIDIRNAIIRKDIPENENSNKIIDVVEKILDFNKQEKGKGVKILTSKQIFQRLPITLAQIKAGNLSENHIFFVSRKRYY